MADEKLIEEAAKAKDQYTEDQRPCVVAKLPCGHIVAACGLDARDSEVSLPSLKEVQDFMLEAPEGTTFEMRPISFVRNGGLSLDHHCDGKARAK